MWYWESKEHKRRGAQKDKGKNVPSASLARHTQLFYVAAGAFTAEFYFVRSAASGSPLYFEGNRHVNNTGTRLSLGWAKLHQTQNVRLGQSRHEPFLHPSLPRHSSADQAKTDLVEDIEEEEAAEDGEEESSERPLPPAAEEVVGEGAKRIQKCQPQPRSSLRPFQQALQALNRLTAAAGKPHDGVSMAVSSFSAPSSVTTGCGRIDGEVGQTKPARVPRCPRAPSADGGRSGRRGGVERGGGGGGGGGGGKTESSSSAGERCRVGFDMIRLMTGPDGNDAGGRPVGVRPGEDVKAAVLSSGRSQVGTAVVKACFDRV